MKKFIEKNRKLRVVEEVILILLCIAVVFCFSSGLKRLYHEVETAESVEKTELYRDWESEDCDEDCLYCDVVFVKDNLKLTKTYSYQQYLQLQDEKITVFVYNCDGRLLCFENENPDISEIRNAYRSMAAEENKPLFNIGISLLILAVSLCVVTFYSQFFSAYEKIWFISIMVLATVFAIIFPEESANGVNGIVIMLLYLLDTFLNILCELLISKQSRYNFIVSVFVEITEIVMCLVLRYRFATMTVTLLFWLPIDIISFINWSRHKDQDDEQLTVVRKLKGYQEMLIILAIFLWTAVVGYVISGLDIYTDFISNHTLETVIIYLDACASAVGIANGTFILFRLREQWIAWYICAALEAVINILSGQYVLLILKLGYFTNTTYGYIRWSRYIRENSNKQY